MPANPEPGLVWLVLPTYNEAANLEAIVAAILEQLPADRRLLIVDDSSPDGTGEIADRLGAADPDVEVLHRPGKQGLGPAYVAGFHRALAAGARLIAQMDADFSHDPADLPRLLAAAREADLVLGSRYVEGGGVAEWGPGRRLISRGGSAYARALLGLRVGDLTGGFKVFRRQVLETIDLETIPSLGYAFQIETTYRAVRAGFRVVEVPIVFRERRVGESKMTGSIVLEAALRVPAMRIARRRS
ncbi:MAG: dolichol-phosphate mannosyltransferase [Solirubrobacterales bacterium]|nr:dolichol-phosphate mannosyltransferase [Solirubrobacterales bacterium]